MQKNKKVVLTHSYILSQSFQARNQRIQEMKVFVENIIQEKIVPMIIWTNFHFMRMTKKELKPDFGD